MGSSLQKEIEQMLPWHRAGKERDFPQSAACSASWTEASGGHCMNGNSSAKILQLPSVSIMRSIERFQNCDAQSIIPKARNASRSTALCFPEKRPDHLPISHASASITERMALRVLTLLTWKFPIPSQIFLQEESRAVVLSNFWLMTHL